MALPLAVRQLLDLSRQKKAEETGKKLEGRQSRPQAAARHGTSACTEEVQPVGGDDEHT
jgi:hypothetical protein